VTVLAQDRCVLFVVLVVPTVINLGRLRSHRRVDNNRKTRYPVLVFELSDQVQDLLRASDGERGIRIGALRLAASFMMAAIWSADDTSPCRRLP
jgi:hypothetical protein